MTNVISQRSNEDWVMYHGDCCEVVDGIPDNSIGLSVHSPPFSSLYIYSDSENDMGNCQSDEEFFKHYKFLIPKLLRVTIPGRLAAVHCKDLPRYANRDGTAGLKDFPGQVIAAFESCGWSYHSRVTIWKCPVTERERTNNNGLLHKTAERDRSQLRQGMADYLVVFRRPPTGTLMSDEPVAWKEDAKNAIREYVGEVDPSENANHPSPFARKKQSPQAHGRSIDIWRRYAEPVWWDINQTNVLGGKHGGIDYRKGREANDERHICPLQLDVIERCVQLWSNPGDVVLSPFAGIGSEGYVAVKLERKFIGIELKKSYYEVACSNLKAGVEVSREGKFQFEEMEILP